MKILFGTFDWGLGHATRDLPILRELIKRNEVDIISTGRALEVLRENLGKSCRYFDVPSIIVPYGKTRFFQTQFTAKIPQMMTSLKKARKESAKIIGYHRYDLIISDCRYDVYDRPDNSYLINHQLVLRSEWFEWLTKQYLAQLMKNYGHIIVPDFPERPLTGRLSYNSAYEGKVVYVGHLSQIRTKRQKEDIDYFVTISGPEPQRTLLEEMILLQLSSLKGKVVVTLGKPDAKEVIKTDNAIVYPFLNAKKQGEMMARAKCIISRSGYTTVMDLVELGKRQVLFIPTPGQTEQEYLAEMYEERKWFFKIDQKELCLARDVARAKQGQGFNPPWKTEESVRKIQQLIGTQKIQHRR